jgi:hypothetical protein
VAVLA